MSVHCIVLGYVTFSVISFRVLHRILIPVYKLLFKLKQITHSVYSSVRMLFTLKVNFVISFKKYVFRYQFSCSWNQSLSFMF